VRVCAKEKQAVVDQACARSFCAAEFCEVRRLCVWVMGF
jgi:hypothetical protein